MAELIRCTDRFAHIELHLPRDLWEELLNRHFHKADALRCVRVSALNGIRARLVELAMQEIESRYAAEDAASPATAPNS